MTTKERIADAALTLFSEKGFRGTSVKSIADAVGIKDSSLYKHYSSKREILDTISAEIGRRMMELSEKLHLPREYKHQDVAEFYGELALSSMQHLCRQALTFYLTDDFVTRFWKLANTERFQHKEIYEMFHRIFLHDSLTYLSEIFSAMTENEILISCDPNVLALEFYSPFFFLISKYIDRAEKLSEALAILDKHIETFFLSYKSTKKGGL